MKKNISVKFSDIKIFGNIIKNYDGTVTFLVPNSTANIQSILLRNILGIKGYEIKHDFQKDDEYYAYCSNLPTSVFFEEKDKKDSDDKETEVTVTFNDIKNIGEMAFKDDEENVVIRCGIMTSSIEEILLRNILKIKGYKIVMKDTVNVFEKGGSTYFVDYYTNLPWRDYKNFF